MERVASLILDALRQALADSNEQRLYKSGKLSGLFPARAGASGEAAAQALRDGLLEITRTEVRGKTTVEWVRLTPRGVDFLYEQESPVMALRGLRDTLATNRAGIPDWLAQMRAALVSLEQRFTVEAQHWQQRLEGLERRLGEALRRIEEAQPLLPADLLAAYPWVVDAINYLDRRASGGGPASCSLPELFAALAPVHPQLSIGAYHEGLRRFSERRVLRLEPIADLSGLTHPEFAMPDGGRILYFAAR